MKRFIAALSILAALICFTSVNAAEISKVKVGVILPMTGNASDWGTMFWNGSRAAIEKLGSHAEIELILEDSKADPKVGISAAQKLINYDGVKVILTGLSPVVHSITAIAEQSKIVVINPVANSPKLSGLSEYLFNSTPLSNEEAEFLAATAFRTYNKRKAAIIYINNESGLGFRNNFAKPFKEMGGTIVYDEGLPLGTTDFRTTILKLKKAKADVVFLATYYKETALIVKQSKEMKYYPFWMSYSQLETPEFLKLAAGAVEGMVYSYSGFISTDKNAKEFINIYQKQFGKEPAIWAGQFYEAVLFLNEAIEMMKDRKNFGPQLVDILSNNTFSGITSKISFDDKHSIKGRFLLKTIKNNKFIFLK